MDPSRNGDRRNRTEIGPTGGTTETVTRHDHSQCHPGIEGRKRPFLKTPAGFALSVFLAIALGLLWLEHRAHVLGVLPLLLPLVICVGMHFLMHRGHGGHGHGSDRDGR